MDRLAGYKLALEENGLAPDPALIWEGTEGTFGDANAITLGRFGAHELFSLANPATALFAINDMYGLGAYRGARDLNLSIPEDVSIVGMDDIMLTEIAQPPLTTIKQPLQQIAELSTKRLIARIQNTYTGAQEHISLTPRLIVRGSTARYQSFAPSANGAKTSVS